MSDFGKDMENMERPQIPPGMEMYFDREIAEKFSDIEQNERHKKVSQIVDRVALHELKDAPDPLHVAELGGGTHPDRYDGLYARLLTQPKGMIDWVDISPFMRELAERHLDEQGLGKRKEVTRFIQQDLLTYLDRQPDASLDLALLKYVAAFLPPADFESFASLLSQKLRHGGCMVATYPYLKPELHSRSTSAKYSLNGESIPDGAIKTLHHGDRIGIKFFQVSGKSESGFLDGAESVQYYHAPEWMQGIAHKKHLEYFLGDWSERLPKEERTDKTMDQAILILTKI